MIKPQLSTDELNQALETFLDTLEASMEGNTLLTFKALPHEGKMAVALDMYDRGLIEFGED